VADAHYSSLSFGSLLYPCGNWSSRRPPWEFSLFFFFFSSKSGRLNCNRPNLPSPLINRNDQNPSLPFPPPLADELRENFLPQTLLPTIAISPSFFVVGEMATFFCMVTFSRNSPFSGCTSSPRTPPFFLLNRWKRPPPFLLVGDTSDRRRTHTYSSFFDGTISAFPPCACLLRLPGNTFRRSFFFPDAFFFSSPARV